MKIDGRTNPYDSPEAIRKQAVCAVQGGNTPTGVGRASGLGRPRIFDLVATYRAGS